MILIKMLCLQLFLEQSESNLILKQKFSSALVKVLGQNEEVRSLIKEEALKQIDFDYDVLYCLIKAIVR